MAAHLFILHFAMTKASDSWKDRNNNNWKFVVRALFSCLCCVASQPALAAEQAPDVNALASVNAQEQPLRRPVALAGSEDGNWIYTANRDSGSVSAVDLASRKPVAEIELGGKLADIARLDDTHLLVLDNQNHELVVMVGGQGNWQVESRLAVPRYPIKLFVDSSRQRCFIASHWSRTLSCVDFAKLDGRLSARLSRQVQLGFEPREMLLIEQGDHLVVAAAYSGKLAIVDANSLELSSIKSIRGHNIRGLAVSHDGKSLLVTHQELNSQAHSTRDDVHWGNMLSNLLSVFPLENLLIENDGYIPGGEYHLLGEPDDAASDPAGLSVAQDSVAIVLSGVNQLAIAYAGNFEQCVRVPVGRHPSAVLRVSEGRWVIAEMFSDALSIVEIAAVSNPKPGSHEPMLNQDAALAEPIVTRIPLGSTRELSLAEQGEMLFFDGHLSHNGWMSCHSCHTDGHSSEQLNDNLSDASYGTPKRVLSLLGVGETRPWAWNGQMQSLEQQVESTIKNTMQGEPISKPEIDAVVAYLKSLTPPPTLAASNLADKKFVQDEALFQSLGCGECHKPPAYTSSGVFDVGHVDEAGLGKFNPPSLRAVGRRGKFLHDNRAESLRDLFSIDRHQLPRTLSGEELELLLAFLNSI